MANRPPISAGEWYHCFNRGVDKRLVFQNEDDCERFLVLLYISNDEDSNSCLANLELHHVTFEKVLARGVVRGTPLVDIGAYAFMPNHVHMIIRPLSDSGLSLFMQKVFTGYAMYFNGKYERTGPLFSGRYKSKHLDSDEYLKHAIQYVLLNPIELSEPHWKKGRGDLGRIEKELLSYRYASVKDFFGLQRSEGRIVHDIRTEYFDKKPSVGVMLRDAQAYYRENARFPER